MAMWRCCRRRARLRWGVSQMMDGSRGGDGAVVVLVSVRREAMGIGGWSRGHRWRWRWTLALMRGKGARTLADKGRRCRWRGCGQAKGADVVGRCSGS